MAKYLKELPMKERVRIEACLFVLATVGRLDMPHGRKIVGKKDLFEIRSGRHRVFYAFHEQELVLLHAFLKKSQATPRREIVLAQGRFISYLNSGG